MENLLETVSKFNLENLDKNWVKNVVQNDYSDDKDLPSDYELMFGDDLTLYDLMKDLRSAVKLWLQDDQDVSLDVSVGSERKSWQTLIKQKIDYKSIIAILSTFIKIQVQDLPDEEARKSSLAASNLYLCLVSIHGAEIFKIFNPILFGQAVEQFRILSLLRNDGLSKRKRNDETQDEVENTEETISPEEKKNLLKLIASGLVDLNNSLNNLHLKNNREVLVQVLHVLIFIIKNEQSTSNFFTNHPKKSDSAFLAYKSYDILKSFCNPNQGDVEETIRYIMRSFLAELNRKDVEIQAAKSKNVVRDHIMQFIKKLLNDVGKPAYLGIKALVQQLCIRSPEKADVRVKCIQQVLDILNILPFYLYNDCMLWIVSLSLADAVKNRLFAIELIAKILTTEKKQNNNENEEMGIYSKPISYKLLLNAIILRFDDISPTIRSKSLGIFAPIVLSNITHIKTIIEDLFNSNEHNDQIFDLKKFFSHLPDDYPENLLPSGKTIVKEIQLSCLDPKVFVRKSALHCMINICKFNADWMTPTRVSIFVKACKDNSVIVRKFMSQSITELLLMAPEKEQLQKAWVNGVVPLIADNEVKSQEKVVEIVGDIVLDNMVKSSLTTSPLEILPWKIISHISDFGLRKLFRLVCRQWAASKRVRNEDIQVLKTHIGTENNKLAWFMLVSISEFQSLHSPNFILEYFFENVYNDVSFDEYCSQLVVEAVHLNWKECDNALIEELVVKLKSSIEMFNVPFIHIARYFDICVMHNETTAKDWAKSLITYCEDFIKKSLSTTTDVDEKLELRLIQHIFTLGEAIQISPGLISNETKDALINFIDIDSMEGDFDLAQRPLTAAVIVITLGKVCLQDQMASKKIVPIFGNLLGKSPTSVKINTMVALTDLCVGFTSLVEPYLGDFSLCLKEEDWNIRNQTLTLLTQLVQEDYIKLKNRILFFILSMINDPCFSIKKNTAMFLVNTVLKKNPRIMCHEFIKAIYFFNAYFEGYVFAQLDMGPREMNAFCLPGNSNKLLRRNIYNFMMEYMDNEQKLKVTCTLCSEILDKVCDGKILHEGKGKDVLEDALFAIASESLRICHSRGPKEDDEDLNLADAEGIKKNLLERISKEVVKKSYMEHCIPRIIRLRRKLSEFKSPLVQDLMLAFRELIKDYKEEIEEMLAGDPEFAAEIMLDLRNLDNAPEDSGAADTLETPLLPGAEIVCEQLADMIIESGGIDIGNPSSQDTDNNPLSILNTENTSEPSNQQNHTPDASNKWNRGSALSPSYNETSPLRKISESISMRNSSIAD